MLNWWLVVLVVGEIIKVWELGLAGSSSKSPETLLDGPPISEHVSITAI